MLALMMLLDVLARAFIGLSRKFSCLIGLVVARAVSIHLLLNLYSWN